MTQPNRPVFRTPLSTHFTPPAPPPPPPPPVVSNFWTNPPNINNFTNFTSTDNSFPPRFDNNQSLPRRSRNRELWRQNNTGRLSEYRSTRRNRRPRGRRSGLYFRNDLSNNFSFRLNNNLMTILNNSLYDYQPRRTLQNENYEHLIETDNWTNLSTRYNLPIDTICPISLEIAWEMTRINKLYELIVVDIYLVLLREWFNFSSLCPVCRHDLLSNLNSIIMI